MKQYKTKHFYKDVITVNRVKLLSTHWMQMVLHSVPQNRQTEVTSTLVMVEYMSGQQLAKGIQFSIIT